MTTQMINMPVEAISESCLTCPELEIDIYTKEQFDLEIPEEGRSEVKSVKYENVLRCKHCDRCKVIFEHGMGETKKTTRKTTKKTVSKK